MTRRRYDPRLRTQPWKVMAVFSPIETVLHRLEMDGTIDVAGRQIVFREESNGNWYDMIAALHGVIEFHQIAATRYGLACDVAPLIKFANKLESGAPVFETDVSAARASIGHCKQQALGLRVSQAASIVDTVRISIEMDRFRAATV